MLIWKKKISVAQELIFPHILFNLACFKATQDRELHSKYQAFIIGNLKKNQREAQRND